MSEIKNNIHIPTSRTGRFVALSVCGALWLASCQDSVSMSPDDPQDHSEMVNVKFYVPSKGASFITGSTRDADDDAYPGNGEGVLSNMYLIAIQTTYYDDTTGKEYIYNNSGLENRVVVTPLNVYEHSGLIENTDETLDTYEVPLYPGQYRFYLFANTDLYVDSKYTASGSFVETDIEDLVLNFSSDTPLRRAHLPMSCTPDRMKYKKPKGTKTPTTDKDAQGQDLPNYTKYTINITREDTPDIYADLEFLCAKVRYTILFDATQPDADDPSVHEGISSGFGNKSIRFYVDESGDYRPSATNLVKKTYLHTMRDFSNEEIADPFIHQTAEASIIGDGNDGSSFGVYDPDSPASWNLELSRYYWPSNGDNYPSKPSQSLTPYDKNLDSWKASRQRAWQGIAYFPENNHDEIAHTIMRFPYVLDTYKEGTENEEYLDGTPSADNFKSITLFGDNKETHYPGTTYTQDYQDPDSDHSVSHGLRRGYFYDVVARVVNPDKWDLKIIVYGRVEEWHETNQNFQEPAW